MKMCQTCRYWEPIVGFYIRPTGSDADAREELAGDCLCPAMQPDDGVSAHITCWNETCEEWETRKVRR